MNKKPSLEEYAQLDEQVERLRTSNRQLARQLSQQRHRVDELVYAVESAVENAINSIVIPKVPKPHQNSRLRKLDSGDEEKAIILVSDLQLGKVTPSYSSEICEQRMHIYADKIESIVNIQRADHPIKELRIYALGDLVEGEMIFATQAYQIDAGLYEQVMIDGPRILCDFVMRMLSIFDIVVFDGVIGNHGRISKFHNPATNSDRMLYKIVEMMFKKESRVKFNLPYHKNERYWYYVDYPFFPSLEHGFLLFHGDQIKGGFAGFPWYGTSKKVFGWKAGSVPDTFQYAVFGHFHTPTRMTLNSITAWCNGTTESTNLYAQEQLAASGEPKQLMMFVHPKIGVTSEHWIKLN